MKKLLITLMCTLILLQCTAHASGSKFTNLCSVIAGDSTAADSSALTADEANSIVNALLGDTPFTEEMVLNCHMVTYLASKCSAAESAPLYYNDSGLVPKEYRAAYLTLESQGKLCSQNGFLKPLDPLTYDFAMSMLSYFDEEILAYNHITKYEGTITEVYLENKATHINLSTSSKTVVLKAKDISGLMVYKDGSLAPYSRNLVRGDNVYIYADEKGEPIYAELTNAQDPKDTSGLSSGYTLYKADLYYLEGNMLITKNAKVLKGGAYTPLNERYTEFYLTADTHIKENFQHVPPGNINRRLLDMNAYIICNASGNALYINVCK